MKNILVVKTSLQGDNGNSSKFVQQYVDGLSASKQVSVEVLDLAAEAPSHLSGAEMQAWQINASDRTEEQQALAEISERYVEAISRADRIVLGLPMYNFDSPSVLKAFFDRIARAGITFKYTEQGPEGLLKGKSAVIFAARGGKYEGTPLDTQTPYIKNFFAFLGITDIRFAYAEGLAMGPESAELARAKINENILELISLFND